MPTTVAKKQHFLRIFSLPRCHIFLSIPSGFIQIQVKIRIFCILKLLRNMTVYLCTCNFFLKCTYQFYDIKFSRLSTLYSSISPCYAPLFLSIFPQLVTPPVPPNTSSGIRPAFHKYTYVYVYNTKNCTSDILVISLKKEAYSYRLNEFSLLDFFPGKDQNLVSGTAIFGPVHDISAQSQVLTVNQGHGHYLGRCRGFV